MWWSLSCSVVCRHSPDVIFIVFSGLRWEVVFHLVGSLWSCSFVVWFTTTYSSTKVVISNPTQGEVYSIQFYVIKFVSDLWQTGQWYSPQVTGFTYKTDCHDITEILLKVALYPFTLKTSVKNICRHSGL